MYLLKTYIIIYTYLLLRIILAPKVGAPPHTLTHKHTPKKKKKKNKVLGFYFTLHRQEEREYVVAPPPPLTLKKKGALFSPSLFTSRVE